MLFDGRHLMLVFAALIVGGIIGIALGMMIKEKK